LTLRFTLFPAGIKIRQDLYQDELLPYMTTIHSATQGIRHITFKTGRTGNVLMVVDGHDFYKHCAKNNRNTTYWRCSKKVKRSMLVTVWNTPNPLFPFQGSKKCKVLITTVPDEYGQVKIVNQAGEHNH
jgi:hypothetical protein